MPGPQPQYIERILRELRECWSCAYYPSLQELAAFSDCAVETAHRNLATLERRGDVRVGNRRSAPSPLIISPPD